MIIHGGIGQATWTVTSHPIRSASGRVLERRVTLRFSHDDLVMPGRAALSLAAALRAAAEGRGEP